MNQFTQDGILFQSPRGGPNTELRLAGSRLVLYTDDQATWDRFVKWRQCQDQVRYTQCRLFDRKEILIAVDMYFPLSARRQLLAALGTKKQGVSQPR